MFDVYFADKFPLGFNFLKSANTEVVHLTFQKGHGKQNTVDSPQIDILFKSMDLSVPSNFHTSCALSRDIELKKYRLI